MIVYLLIAFCLLVLLYAYVGYPRFLAKKATGKSLAYAAYLSQDELPCVYILIPVHNEEKVIIQKLKSVFESSYPQEKIQVLIGLDACTDNTKKYIQENFSTYPIQLFDFTERQGKPAMLNKLMAYATEKNAITIFTDADIFFNQNTLFELVKYFKDERIGLVDTIIQTQRSTDNNEQFYWNYENEIKWNESLVYGKITGPSGGCYAIRTKLYEEIPVNFVVDDFFIGMKIALKKYHTIVNKEALAIEEIQTNWIQEFRRKSRIASGNFQNLWYFKKTAFQVYTPLGFIFFSHKFLRWKTPFILLILYDLLLFKATLLILIVTFILPVFDAICAIFGWAIKPLRRLHYFLFMNLAVFWGFINFCKGIKSNVWQPTPRK